MGLNLSEEQGKPRARPRLSHMGIYVRDLPAMEAFYRALFLFTVSDRGYSRTFQSHLVFLTGDSRQHHQLVLGSGRPDGAEFSTIFQMSFNVGSIDELRSVRTRAVALAVTDLKPLNHGNALSVYFRDPEGNMVEVYMDTDYYVTQPHGDPLDLDASDDEIMRQTEEVCRRDASFLPGKIFRDKVDRELSSIEKLLD